MGKLFITLGIMLIIIGVIWTFIGKLPGDITIKRENVTIHLPIMTSIVVSIVVSLLLIIIGKIR